MSERERETRTRHVSSAHTQQQRRERSTRFKSPYQQAHISRQTHPRRASWKRSRQVGSVSMPSRGRGRGCRACAVEEPRALRPTAMQCNAHSTQRCVSEAVRCSAHRGCGGERCALSYKHELLMVVEMDVCLFVSQLPISFACTAELNHLNTIRGEEDGRREVDFQTTTVTDGTWLAAAGRRRG